MTRQEKSYVAKLATRAVIGHMQRLKKVIDPEDVATELLGHPAFRFIRVTHRELSEVVSKCLGKESARQKRFLVTRSHALVEIRKDLP